MGPRVWRISLAMAVMVLLVAVVVGSVAASVTTSEGHLYLASPDQQEERIHVVSAGETLAGIAHLYDVSMGDLMRLNGITNPNFIFAGQRLRLPGLTPTSTPAPDRQVHVVIAGETLARIANRYGVSMRDLMRLNGITNQDFIFVGQRLSLPGPLPPQTPTPTPMPPATLTPTPPPCGCLHEEAIIISGPTEGMTITSPVQVTGIGQGFEQSLSVHVLDETGTEIGLGFAMVAADMGQRGPFTGTVPFTMPLATQWGRIQIYSISPRDGAIEHLNSVTIRLLGTVDAELAAEADVEVPATATPEGTEGEADTGDMDGAETFMAAFKIALEAEDYLTLQALMHPDSFVIGFYLSEGVNLTPERAIEQLETNYMGPGDVVLREDVDGFGLLEDRASFGPSVKMVLYSTGWGEEGEDDAFLIFEEPEDGQFYWTAMLYVRGDLRDYPLP